MMKSAKMDVASDSSLISHSTAGAWGGGFLGVSGNPFQNNSTNKTEEK